MEELEKKEMNTVLCAAFCGADKTYICEKTDVSDETLKLFNSSNPAK